MCTDFVWNSQNSIYLNVRESALPVWEDIVHMISEWYSRKDLGQAKVKANIYPLVVIIKMYNLLSIILHPVGFCWEEKYWHVFHITTMTTLRDSKVMEYIATQHFQLYTRGKQKPYTLSHNQLSTRFEQQCVCVTPFPHRFSDRDPILTSAFSCAHIGFLWMLRFPPTFQRPAIELFG